jgi:hypothetical protein
MQLFGVWAAVLAGRLDAGSGIGAGTKTTPLAAVLLAGVARERCRQPRRPAARIDTAYADYEVETVVRGGMISPRAFRGQQPGRLADRQQRAAALCPLRSAPATHPARRPRLTDRDILVLGAGGFTLSHREPLNRYTFVDIDPAIRAIAEREFLREPAIGEFIATDARRFVADTGTVTMPWWSMSIARAPRFPATW